MWVVCSSLPTTNYRLYTTLMDWGQRVTYLASTALKDRVTPFGIKDSDREQHLCVLGKVGSGRAELLARIALQDIERGMGIVVLDAGGNLGPLIMERLSGEARGRLAYLDAADAEYPFSWSAVEEFRGTEAGAALFKAMLPSVYNVAASPLTDFVADHILKKPDASILELFHLVGDEKRRGEIMPAESEEAKKLASLMEAEKESVATITEGGRYLAKDTMVRNLVGQIESKLKLSALGSGGIVILDLSRIRVFPTRVTPLVRMFAFAARAASAKAGKPAALFMHDCLRYLSESDAENLFTDHSMSLALSDTVYRESDQPLRERVLSRCGSVISFEPHQADREMVQKVFYPYVSNDDLTALEPGEACVALSIDGQRSKPFFATALPLADRQSLSLQDLYVESRQKYGTTRIKVDQSFKKVDEEKDKDKKGPPFTDAFKNIFNKRQAAGAMPPKPGESSPSQPPREDVTPPNAPVAAPPPPKATEDKPKEVAEDDLRQLLYVGPLPA